MFIPAASVLVLIGKAFVHYTFEFPPKCFIFPTTFFFTASRQDSQSHGFLGNILKWSVSLLNENENFVGNAPVCLSLDNTLAMKLANYPEDTTLFLYVSSHWWP